MPDDHDQCFSTTCKNNNFISNTISFIFSHPLYLFYFIFFSPYLFKFIFFISSSPLFLTTTLLVLLSVIATSLPHSKLGFLQTIVDKIHSKLNQNDREKDDEFVEFEDFEIYKIVFRDPPLIIEEDTVAVTELEKEKRLERLFEELNLFEESTAEIEMKQNLQQVMLTSSISMAEIEMKQVKVTSSISTAEIEMNSDLENVLGELRKSETVMVTSSFSGDDQLTTEKSNSSRFDSSSSFGSYESIEEDSTAVIEIKTQSDHKEFAGQLHKLPPVPSSITGENQLNSRRLNDSPVKVVEEYEKLKPVTSSISVNSVIDVDNLVLVDSSSSFGSYGSMRKEKDWKRTLACKLFEERRNLEGGEEGMDSLWESYETDNSSRKSQLKLTNKNTINKKSVFKYFDDCENEEDDDEEDEFTSNGKLCCLKALKLSTGKMNLGMGKPNLVKISKALKGFGWLHHVGSKHGKKK